MLKSSYIKIVTVLISAIILTSCSGISHNNDDSPIIVNSEKQNVLKLAVESVDTLNPVFTYSDSVYNALQLIFEPLFSFDEAQNPICTLAESCIVSDNGLKYTIKTRQDIKWHNGAAFTSYDALHTINLIRYNDSPLTQTLSCISTVTATDANTLVITLGRPVPNFTALLSFPIVQDSVTPEDIANYIPIGTGPYKYSGKATNDSILLTINEDYRSQKPAIPEIHLFVLKDEVAVADAFNSGGIDAVTSTTMDVGTNAPRGDVYTNDYVTNNMVFLGINNSHKLLTSANTRKALSYLIDKQALVTTEIFSRAQVADIPVNPTAWYYKGTPETTHDTDYITEVLALDGWTKNESGYFKREREQYTEGEDEPVLITEQLKLDIIVNDDNDERYRIAVKIGDAFNKFGIETTVTLLSFEDYSTRINEKNYSLFIGEIKMSKNMDQYSLLCEADNYFSYSSDEMYSAVYNLGVLENADQKEQFSQFYNVFTEEMPFVPLFFRKESVIFKKSISGTSMPTVFSAYQNPQNWYISQKN